MAPTTRSASRRHVLQAVDEEKENTANKRSKPSRKSTTSSDKGLKRSKPSTNESTIWSHSDIELLDELGTGAQSRVVRGRDKRDGEIYAIKMINYNCNRKYADRELEIHQSLDFPGVVRLHGHYFISEPPHNSLCLVLEYCPNTMLDKIRAKPDGRIQESEAAVYIADITKTLVYLHEKKLIHRDIKLANILVSTDNKAKIADFGISASIRDPRMRKTIIGTEGYMAPEIEYNTAASEAGEVFLQKAREGGEGVVGHDIPFGVDLYDSQYNEKVDLWSLGATLYAIVTGNLPCEGNETTEYNSDFDFCFDSDPDTFNFDFPDFLSTEAMDLILGLLEEDPSDRISLQDVESHPWTKKHTS
jgi:serine/threonine protein kinase